MSKKISKSEAVSKFQEGIFSIYMDLRTVEAQNLMKEILTKAFPEPSNNYFLYNESPLCFYKDSLRNYFYAVRRFSNSRFCDWGYGMHQHHGREINISDIE